MSIKLCRWGNSLGIRLPKHIAERTGLIAGDYLYMRLADSGDIVIRPVKEREVLKGYEPLEKKAATRSDVSLDKW